MTFIIAIGVRAVLEAQIQLDVSLDVPKLDASIREVHHVNSTCDPAPPTSPSDQVYDNLLLLTPSIGFNAFEVFTESASIGSLSKNAHQSFSQDYDKNLTTACFLLDSAHKTLGPVAATKPSSLPSGVATNYVSYAGLLFSVVTTVFLLL